MRKLPVAYYFSSKALFGSAEVKSDDSGGEGKSAWRKVLWGEVSHRQYCGPPPLFGVRL